jgi:type III pantothenate kinase
MLLIDSGNSAIKTRHIHAGQTQDRVFSLLDGVQCSGLSDYLGSLQVEQVCLASVVRGAAHEHLVELLRRELPQARLVELRTLPTLGTLKNAYPDHRQLGIDRWLAVVAAREITQGNAIVIDAGTALKIELLATGQGYLGGLILPGFNTTPQRFRQLFPSIDFDDAVVKQEYLPGISTAQCLRPLEEPLTCELLRRLVEQAVEVLGDSPQILLAGQDAPRIGACLTHEYRIVPDLVFRGMLKQMQSLG